MDAFCKELSGKELEEFCKKYDEFWLNMQKYIPIEGETPEEIASNYLKDQAEMTRHVSCENICIKFGQYS